MMGLVDLCENPTYERSRHTKDTQGTLGVGANSSVGECLLCMHKALGLISGTATGCRMWEI